MLICLFFQLLVDSTSQISGDSIVQTIGGVNNFLINSSNITTQDLTVDFLIPFLILVFFSLLKCSLGVTFNDFDIYGFFAEMPVDVLSIYVSFILGRFILEGNYPSGIVKPIILILSIFICFLFNCIFRQIVLSMLGSSKFRWWKAVLIIVAEFLISIICLFSILYIL